MPNIAKVLKDEIQRLARREVNQTIAPLKKSNTSLKKTITEHEQRIYMLEKENRMFAAQQGKFQKQVQSDTSVHEADDFRITGKQVRSLRGRIGISQVKLAKLIGASINTVLLWENKPGQLRIQKPEVRKALSDLKGMTKEEVQKRIGKSKPIGKKTDKTKQKKITAITKKSVQSKITANMIKRARKKLDVSQLGLAKLIGVSYQTVSQWESKPGKLIFKDGKTEIALLDVMEMTKDQAQRRLARKK